MPASLKLKALIALSLMLVSGLVSGVYLNSNFVRNSGAYTPPSFGIENSGYVDGNPVTSITYSLTTTNPNDTVIVYASSPNPHSDDNLNVSDSLGNTWTERFNTSWIGSSGNPVIGQQAEFWTTFNDTVSSDTVTLS